MDAKESGGSPVTKLKTLNLKDKRFTANGHNYIIEDSLSYDRWNEYLKAQVYIAFNVSFPVFFGKLKEAYSLLNQQQFADASVCIHDIMQGVKNAMDLKVDPAMKLCALFINREDEDRRYITDSQVEDKINDWLKEGYDVQSFFVLALHSIPGFIEAYKSISHDSSKISRKQTAQAASQ